MFCMLFLYFGYKCVHLPPFESTSVLFIRHKERTCSFLQYATPNLRFQIWNLLHACSILPAVESLLFLLDGVILVNMIVGIWYQDFCGGNRLIPNFHGIILEVKNDFSGMHERRSNYHVIVIEVRYIYIFLL